MAIVTTSVSPTVRITPFTGIPEIQRERSGIARAEVVYSSDGIWDATAAGDNRGLIFTWDLDPDYGHVLMDCSCVIIVSGAYLDMEASAWMEIETKTSGDSERQYYPLVSYASRMDGAGTTRNGQHYRC